MQEEIEAAREQHQKKMAEKDIVIEELQREVKMMSSKYHALANELEEKDKMLRDSYDRLRE
jgi:hypothetical protein